MMGEGEERPLSKYGYDNMGLPRCLGCRGLPLAGAAGWVR